jgi:hypothetical protein
VRTFPAEKIIFIERAKYFESDSMPTVDALRRAFVEKYGPIDNTVVDKTRDFGS